MAMKYIDSHIFFKIKESILTRGHKFTPAKERSGLDVRKYSFSQRIINVSNILSNDCVHASSVVQEHTRRISSKGGLQIEYGQITTIIMFSR